MYPNEDRSAADVTEALIRTVRAARNGGPPVTRRELLRRAQLRQNFGAVVRAHPVDPAVEVPRAAAVEDLIAASSRWTIRAHRPGGRGAEGEGGRVRRGVRGRAGSSASR